VADVPQPGGELVGELNKVLDSATSQPAGAGGPQELLFGLSLWGLLLASVFGLFGVAYLVYAKKQQRLIIGLCGIVLLVFPLFVTNTVAMAVVGVVVLFLPAALKRVGIDL